MEQDGSVALRGPYHEDEIKRAKQASAWEMIVKCLVWVSGFLYIPSISGRF